jgi:hypothetical protein
MIINPVTIFIYPTPSQSPYLLKYNGNLIVNILNWAIIFIILNPPSLWHVNSTKVSNSI